MSLETHDRRRARLATGLLATFDAAGVLEAADVHVARRIGTLTGEDDDRVRLAVAVAVRAVRAGSVCSDLTRAAELAPELPWPAAEPWLAAVAASRLVADGVLRLEGSDLYLRRYWAEEGQVVDDLTARDAASPPQPDAAALDAALASYFPGEGSRDQRDAAELACRRWTSVITGGPGTGKTTTIARMLGVLLAVEGDGLRVALAAPTGKAAARMTEALRHATDADDFPGRDGTDADAARRRDRIRELEASTIHRLLGWRSDSSTRFRHDRANPLRYDVVVVDETSMVSLTLMARLLEGVRPQARLVMVGDAQQLASVEAGAVLHDLVRGWSDRGPVRTLGHVHRFGENIAELAAAVNAGDADAVVDLLRAGREPGEPGQGAVSWVEADSLGPLLGEQAWQLWEAGLAGDAAAALHAFESHRLLCAHRDGPYGVGWWNRHVHRLLMERLGVDFLDEWHPGRPFLVNTNDRGLQLWNGDTGVACLAPGAPSTGGRAGGPRMLGVLAAGGHGTSSLPTSRLADVTTAYAMTVHRSQGSQFAEVTVLLPEPDSRILTRELFYTAVTRASAVVRVVGSEESVRAAVTRRAQRATGLARRLARPDLPHGRTG
jgi:exodeoxyribonuclease V alpha subunit